VGEGVKAHLVSVDDAHFRACVLAWGVLDPQWRDVGASLSRVWR